jgi:hypothetical protein
VRENKVWALFKAPFGSSSAKEAIVKVASRKKEPRRTDERIRG